MRIPHREQLHLDCPPVAQVVLNVKCRDRMIPILRGLQHLFNRSAFLQQALHLVSEDVLGDADPTVGREGMTLWQILVLAAVRQGCNFTYDHLHDLVDNHGALRQILQVGDWEDESFNWQRIRDNICRVRPETLESINHLIVAEGHRLEPRAADSVRGDAFVVETNIHYPTESGLILDGLKKILLLAPQLAALLGLSGWRQHQSLRTKAQKAARRIGRMKKDTNYADKLPAAYRQLFAVAEMVLPRTQELLDAALKTLRYYQDGCLPSEPVSLLYQELMYWHSATEHVCHTAWRRVIEGETVPNAEKLFSLFEPHTELIKRGKAAQPIQFGHSVLVMEDALGFICHYKIVPSGVEERTMLVPEMKTLQKRLQGRIQSASFDRGFHSASNQTELAALITHPCLPKPGTRQAAEQEQKATVQFRQARRRHSGVESAIGALQSGNGLAKCRDHSQIGYDRYIGLGILGRNLIVLGKLLLAREHPDCLAAKSQRAA